MDKITVDEIAARLQLRKSIHRHTVLFLGARAGALFRNSSLYQLIERFISNSTSFRTLQEPEKFDKCYQALSSFNEREIYEILLACLKEPIARPEDDALAGIVREDVFDVIISTNIDPFVEEAFVRAGLREPFEYHVFIPELHLPKDIRRPETQYCTLVKVFGDWKSRPYNTAGNEFVLEANRELKEFLEATLSGNLLIVGYDPVWDAPIERAFPLLEGDCWYVNEEPPEENSHLAHMIRTREGKSLIGAQGSYGNFITALHSKLMLSPSEEDMLEVTVPLLQALQPAKELPPVPGEEKKSKVFISYSHKDARALKRLRIQITSVERAGLIDVWDDTKIKPGTDWRQEIKIALEQARVAILLVSADFLASKFIAENELPPLLAAAEAGGTVVVPVILSPCLFDESPLSRFQAVNDPSKPLSGMKPYERDEIWVEVIRFIIKEVQFTSK